MPEPTWQKVTFPAIDYQDAYYYSAPKSPDDGPNSLDEVDPQRLETYEKLGLPLSEQKLLDGVAVDAGFAGVSVAPTFRKNLEEAGSSCRPTPQGEQTHPD